MPRVVHFEIHADNPQRASTFYSEVFHWQIQKWEGPQDYWLISTGPKEEPGIDGAITHRTPGQKGEAFTAYVCTIDVPSVDDYSARVSANGGSIMEPKMAVPHVGWLAYCRDTEGNTFGIMQSDPSAI